MPQMWGRKIDDEFVFDFNMRIIILDHANKTKNSVIYTLSAQVWFTGVLLRAGHQVDFQIICEDNLAWLLLAS